MIYPLSNLVNHSQAPAYPLGKFTKYKFMKLKAEDVNWSCRFHPTDSSHEVGCPHQKWTKEEIYQHLLSKKKFEQDQWIRMVQV